MKWKEEILHLSSYQPGKSIDEVKRELGLKKIVKLASNENPYGSPKQCYDYLREYNDSFAIYPDGYAYDLRMAIADHWSIKPTQIIFGDGSDEIITIIARALLKPGVNTVCATPTFSQYRHNGIIEGAEVREIPLLENGEHDLSRMLEAIDKDTSVVWICNPNNPTGVYMNEEKILTFLKQVPKDCLVVFDEAYYEYVTAEDYPNTLELLQQYENVMILRTFSKIYGLASFRVGYGIAQEEVIKKLEPLRAPFNVNVLGQKLATIAIKDQDFVQQCKIKNREGLQKIYRFCEEHQLSYYLSQGNFVLIDFKRNGNEVFQELLKLGFIVRSGVPLGFPTCVRITIGTEEQMDGLTNALKVYTNSLV